MKRNSIQRKMVVLLVTVALVSTLLTTTVSLYAARHLFTDYLYQTTAVQTDIWAAVLADYYQENGSFDGVEEFLASSGTGKGRGHYMRGGSYRNHRLLLASPAGKVLYDSADLNTGNRLTSTQLAWDTHRGKLPNSWYGSGSKSSLAGSEYLNPGSLIPLLYIL